MVQDIATIVSSLYMRGLNWNYIPTTFLGMTDSCIGGKSSINVGQYKNLIGNFHPPSNIEIMPSLIKTLPKINQFVIEITSFLVEILSKSNDMRWRF